MNKYTIPETAHAYIQWLASEDGRTQQELLGATITASLPAGTPLTILDAACGTGWLAGLLHTSGHRVVGCDESKSLLEQARASFTSIEFRHASLIEALPYPENSFDAVVVNMAAQDVPDFSLTAKNLYHILKPKGTLLITIPNPSYAYPVGVWKRGILGRLLGRKPSLKLRPWPAAAQDIHDHTISWSNHWRPTSTYINSLSEASFLTRKMHEIKSDRDADHFSLRYQLYRYPLFLLLECVKASQ